MLHYRLYFITKNQKRNKKIIQKKEFSLSHSRRIEFLLNRLQENQLAAGCDLAHGFLKGILRVFQENNNN